jgi:outer membrane protein assembly factor BamB
MQFLTGCTAPESGTSSVPPAQSAQAGDWPQWRGPDRTDVSRETDLLKQWPADGPKRVWMFENAGNGYSGQAIVGDRLYTLGTRDGSEILLALNAATGREVWATKLSDILQNNWGNGPRSTPSVDGDRVYAMSGPGVLTCANVKDGTIVWQTKMSDLGGKVPGWGYTESPLVDGDHVLCTPGGDKGAIAALDKKTGKLVWQTTEFTDGAQYASIVPAVINGTRQYVQLTMKTIAGISAKDGKQLWKEDFSGRTAVIPTPIVKDNHVYVAAGYGVGSKMIKVNPDNTVATVYENKVMKNHHGGVILVGEHLYGYSDGPGWVCQNFMTGEEVWAEKNALGKGAIGCADGMFYCLDEGTGTVVLIDASSEGWKEHGRFKLDPQSKIRSSQGRVWTHPVISHGRLYLRDQDLVYCFDVKKP